MKTDSQLKTDVAHELAWDTRIDETAIGVCAHHGVVTLTGTVDSWADKHAAEEAAHRVAGVLDVANEIADGALHDAIKRALARHVAREVERIAVDIDGDTVVLSGVVASWQERRAVLGAAKGTPGVRRIDDRLRIQG